MDWDNTSVFLIEPLSVSKRIWHSDRLSSIRKIKRKNNVTLQFTIVTLRCFMLKEDVVFIMTKPLLYMLLFKLAFSP